MARDTSKLKTGKSDKAQRAERLANELRANLQRRKAVPKTSSNTQLDKPDTADE